MRKVPISRKWGIHVEEVRYHFGASLVLSIISGKWKPSIICELDEGGVPLQRIARATQPT